MRRPVCVARILPEQVLDKGFPSRRRQRPARSGCRAFVGWTALGYRFLVPRGRLALFGFDAGDPDTMGLEEAG